MYLTVNSRNFILELWSKNKNFVSKCLDESNDKLIKIEENKRIWQWGDWRFVSWISFVLKHRFTCINRFIEYSKRFRSILLPCVLYLTKWLRTTVNMAAQRVSIPRILISKSQWNLCGVVASSDQQFRGGREFWYVSKVNLWLL
jgi:hypothetical protein